MEIVVDFDRDRILINEEEFIIRYPDSFLVIIKKILELLHNETSLCEVDLIKVDEGVRSTIIQVDLESY